MLFAQDDIALAREFFVRFYANVHIQITTRAAADCFTVFLQPNSRAVVDTSRNFDSERLFAALRSFASTYRTDFFWDLARTSTGLTSNCLLNLAEDSVHDARLLAGTLTGRAGFHAVAWLDSRAVTVFTLVFHVECQFFVNAKNCLLEAERYGRFYVAAALWPSITLPAAAKKLAEYIAKTAIAKVEVNVLVTATKAFERIATGITTGSTIATNPGVTELVVPLAFLLVFKYLVRFVDFFELRLVATFFVRVVLYGSLTERLFYFIGAGTLGYL
jgi:hypothetical protein